MSEKSCDTCFYEGRAWDYEPCSECKGIFCHPRLNGFPKWQAFKHVPQDRKVRVMIDTALSAAIAAQGGGE